MAQVGPALCTHGLDAHHAVAAVLDLPNGTGHGKREAGPAAARVELGVGVEQLGTAADAVVTAVGPVAFVLAAEGPLGGRVTRDLVSRGLGALGLQQRLPFVFGFLDGVGHEEQLMEMEDAQSGGKPA